MNAVVQQEYASIIARCQTISSDDLSAYCTQHSTKSRVLSLRNVDNATIQRTIHSINTILHSGDLTVEQSEKIEKMARDYTLYFVIQKDVDFKEWLSILFLEIQGIPFYVLYEALKIEWYMDSDFLPPMVKIMRQVKDSMANLRMKRTIYQYELDRRSQEAQ